MARRVTLAGNINEAIDLLAEDVIRPPLTPPNSLGHGRRRGGALRLIRTSTNCPACPDSYGESCRSLWRCKNNESGTSPLCHVDQRSELTWRGTGRRYNLSPGNSPGLVSFGGDVELDAVNTPTMDLGGALGRG